MPTRKISFVQDRVYHICSRGVEKRKIFLENKDYFRFIHDLYEFNDEAPAELLYYKQPFLQTYEVRPHRRKLLVELLAFALMPNHYHLLIRQLREKGIIYFMQKIGTGYAMYFNQKYQRSGALFEGRFRAIHVEREAHFIHLPFYIHANPLDLKFPEWRQQKLRNPGAAMDFLENYRWSSFPDYIGKKNFGMFPKYLLMASREKWLFFKSNQRFRVIVRVYGHTTREISLLPREYLSFRQASQTVCYLQTHLEHSEEAEREKA